MVSVESGLKLEVAHSFDHALGEGGIVTPSEWDTLLASSPSDVVFLTWQWQSLWWQHFGASANCKLHLLVLRDQRGAPVGIAPLFIAADTVPPLKEYVPGEERPEGEGDLRRVVRFVGGIEIADYLDVIAPAEMLGPVWGAVLEYLNRLENEWDLVDLHSLPDGSESRIVLQSLSGQYGLDCRTFPEDVSPVLELPGDWNTYLMSLRKKDRHELRRKVRKLEGRDDARWYLVNPSDTGALQRAVSTFVDLHRSSGEDKAKFMDEQMAAFFAATVPALASTGWLDLAILEIDKHPAAAYFSFNYKERIYLYNSGYEPRWASYSAGIALLAYRIHKAILQHVRVFDFLRGDEPYKYDFGARNTYVYRIVLTRGEKV
ncbi:MAG TPA: GNAT family N-acetyltransferase [Chloroflexia bacterium]|nr:GNAT family N-acetyltransferase [Chloroflexia bacterium]